MDEGAGSAGKIWQERVVKILEEKLSFVGLEEYDDD